MTTITAEEAHLLRLIEEQTQAIVRAMERRCELKSQLAELRQQNDDRRPAMRALLEMRGAAAVAEAERILRELSSKIGG